MMNACPTLLVFGAKVVLIASLLFISQVNSKPVVEFQTTITKNSRGGTIFETIDVTLFENADGNGNGYGEVGNGNADAVAGDDTDNSSDADADADANNADNAEINIPDFSSRIVGGDQSEIGEFPYYTENMSCYGGALIASDWLLTVAHCGDITGNEVNVGAYERFSFGFGSQVRVCEKYIRNPDFACMNSEYTDSIEPCFTKYPIAPLINDFALCKLDQPVNIDDSKVTLQLNTDPNFPEVGSDVTAIGMGFTSETRPPSTFLQDVVIKVDSNKQCSNEYGSAAIQPQNICASVPEGDKSACYGDSGGPLVTIQPDPNDNRKVIHILVGIISWGGECRGKTVFSRVSSGIDFIFRTICEEDGSTSTFCSPTVNCKDDKSYAFQNKNKNKKYCKKKIESNNSNKKKRKKLCKKLDTKNNNKPVSFFCPRFCKKECRVLNE